MEGPRFYSLMGFHSTILLLYYSLSIRWKRPCIQYYFDGIPLPPNQSELSKKFKVSGIPTLAFLYGDTGKLITSDGRAIVMEDPEGADFPWIPKKFTDIIPGKLLGKDGTETNWSNVKADVIGLYFSAHWVSHHLV